MDGWLVRLNEAMTYIESHLDSDISYDRAASIAGCSTYHFLRMFAYIADVPLSEYIRRRRLSKAVFDLKTGDNVLDVALRYGYESPTAFTRAFRILHGVSPSRSRKEGTVLKAYSPITFTMNIQGAREMEYRIETKPSFTVVGVSFTAGKELEASLATIPEFWDSTRRSGMLERICGHIGKEPRGLLGICGGIDDKNIEYTIATASDETAPEGMVHTTIPAAIWAIFPGRGAMPQAIHELYKRIMGEWLPMSGYEFGEAPDIERYITEDTTDQEFEIWIPIVKKN